MNVFPRRNFKLDDPIKQGISCYEKRRNGQRGVYDGEPTTALERHNYVTINKLPSPWLYFSVDVFPRSTENDPFVQFQSITNDDVLANNIHHQLGAYDTPGTHLLQEKMISQA